jgi:hypothetical protein
MTIDEMIGLLNSHALTDRVFGGTRYEQIIAALRAGQVMRVSREGTKTHDKACEAWDEATKEDV